MPVLDQKNWFILKVILDDNRWLPACVHYESDGAIKGYAVFTEMGLVQHYSYLLEQGGHGLPKEPLLLDKDTVQEYLKMLSQWATPQTNPLKAFCVYVDPPSLSCKGDIKPDFKNLDDFLYRHFESALKFDYQPIEFIQYKGCTIAVFQHIESKNYVATTVKGEAKNRHELNELLDAAAGTTEHKFFHETAPMALLKTAVNVAKTYLDKIIIVRR